MNGVEQFHQKKYCIYKKQRQIKGSHVSLNHTPSVLELELVFDILTFYIHWPDPSILAQSHFDSKK